MLCRALLCLAHAKEGQIIKHDRRGLLARRIRQGEHGQLCEHTSTVDHHLDGDQPRFLCEPYPKQGLCNKRSDICSARLLVNWLGSTEDRLLQDVARLNRNQDGVQKPRLNQYNAPKTFIGNLDAMVTVATEEMERKRTKSKILQPGKLGTYLFFEQQEIKVAKAMGGVQNWTFAQWDTFREATRNKWAYAMSGQEKLEVMRARTVAASAKPFRQPRIKSQSAKARFTAKSAYRVGTSSRPVADSIVDRYPCWNVSRIRKMCYYNLPRCWSRLSVCLSV